MESVKKWLRDWGTLISAAAFALVLILTVQSAARAADVADQAKKDACAASKISNDALLSFFIRQVNLRPPKNPQATALALADLRASYADAEIKCLNGK